MNALETKLAEAPPSLRRRILQISYHPDGVYVLSEQPEICGVCGQPHYFFVNRGRGSCCWACDGAAGHPGGRSVPGKG